MSYLSGQELTSLKLCYPHFYYVPCDFCLDNDFEYGIWLDLPWNNSSVGGWVFMYQSSLGATEDGDWVGKKTRPPSDKFGHLGWPLTHPSLSFSIFLFPLDFLLYRGVYRIRARISYPYCWAIFHIIKRIRFKNSPNRMLTYKDIVFLDILGKIFCR